MRRQLGIDQLRRGCRAHQHHGPAPGILDIVGDHRITALRRHPLQHQPAGAPAAFRPGPRHRQLEPGLHLLGLAEIMLRALGQRVADQLDDRLVTLGILALIDGKGDVAAADQIGHGRAVPRAQTRLQRRFEPLGIVLGIAAHRPVCRYVGHDQAHRAVAFGLQRKDAVIFQRAGEHDCQGDRLAEDRRHRIRVIVLRQDAVDRRPQPH